MGGSDYGTHLGINKKLLQLDEDPRKWQQFVGPII